MIGAVTPVGPGVDRALSATIFKRIGRPYASTWIHTVIARNATAAARGEIPTRPNAAISDSWHAVPFLRMVAAAKRSFGLMSCP